MNGERFIFSTELKFTCTVWKPKVDVGCVGAHPCLELMWEWEARCIIKSSVYGSDKY